MPKASPATTPQSHSPDSSSHGRRVGNKSSRTQFSACGACRMRRVKCDLKEVQVKHQQARPCTNCAERDFRCIDEFAEAKVAKLHRRGRGIQRVENVYGRRAQEYLPAEAYGHHDLHAAAGIPRLQPEFLSSPFFRMFQICHPLLDPAEISTRFFDFAKGNDEALDTPGTILAMVLAVWASSYGVDETGQEDTHHGATSVRYRKQRTNEMVTELLVLVDKHALLRKPSWDGVRALLLLLPLCEDLQSPVERLTLHEAAISQAYTLCTCSPVSSIAPGYENILDTPTRVRIYCYAHILESTTAGLRGGRLLLSEDDLSSFQAAFPPIDRSAVASETELALQLAYQHYATPLRLASVCRHLQRILTGSKARMCSNLDEAQLCAAWDRLDSLWSEFDVLRPPTGPAFLAEADLNLYIHSWQIFLFECHNVIREALKQRLNALRKVTLPVPSSDTASALREIRIEQAARLHKVAGKKCLELAEKVLSFIRPQLGTSFFPFNTVLTRDGCFFAGLVFAEADSTQEQMQTCFAALREMRWAYSKSEEREQTLMMVWEASMAAKRQAIQSESAATAAPSGTPPLPPPASSQLFRHIPTPLWLVDPALPIDSAPNTATTATTDKSGWTSSTHASGVTACSHPTPPASHTTGSPLSSGTLESLSPIASEFRYPLKPFVMPIQPPIIYEPPSYPPNEYSSSQAMQFFAPDGTYDMGVDVLAQQQFAGYATVHQDIVY